MAVMASRLAIAQLLYPIDLVVYSTRVHTPPRPWFRYAMTSAIYDKVDLDNKPARSPGDRHHCMFTSFRHRPKTSIRIHQIGSVDQARWRATCSGVNPSLFLIFGSAPCVE